MKFPLEIHSPFITMTVRMFRFVVVILVAAAVLAGCARAPLKKREDALRPASAPSLADDLALEPLAAAVRAQAAVLRATPTGRDLVFGKRTFRRDQYAYGLETFATLVETVKDKDALFARVKELFDFYEVYGGDSWGEVMITSYFEPEVNGSRKRTEKFTQPLLRPPGDLVDVALSKFDDRFAEATIMRGRLVAMGYPPGKLQLVPYFTRDEIDRSNVLGKRGLEIVYTDPIDAFFMQIQGSGTVVLEDGTRVRVGYGDQNGHKYESIGRFMTDVLPKGKITATAIESYLRSLPEERSRAYMNRNPSYVFFREREGQPTTMFGTPAIGGRTIATDPRYFSKGTLAFLAFEKPRWSSDAAPEPEGFDKASRFVVDDDTGGAIRGGGRVDLFWGSGAEARRNASVMKQPGKLFYLAPKDDLLKRMQQ